MTTLTPSARAREIVEAECWRAGVPVILVMRGARRRPAITARHASIRRLHAELDLTAGSIARILRMSEAQVFAIVGIAIRTRAAQQRQRDTQRDIELKALRRRVAENFPPRIAFTPTGALALASKSLKGEQKHACKQTISHDYAMDHNHQHQQ